MSHDPFDDYAAKMQEVRTPDRLRDEVLKKAAAERQAASATGKVPVGSSATCNNARPRAGAAASSHGEPPASPAHVRAPNGLRSAGSPWPPAWPRWRRSWASRSRGRREAVPCLRGYPTAFAVKAYGAVDDACSPPV